MKQTLIFLLATFSLSAQVKGIVLDSISGKPIAYVNIWVENENIGTTSEENGTFSLETTEEKMIVFSALGYQTRKMKVSKLQKIYLSPRVYELEEVVVTSPKRTKEIEMGAYESRGFHWHLNSNFTAIYFETNKEVIEHPFLKQLKFQTISEIKNAKIKIRIMECKIDFSIGDDITANEIIVEVKKGSRENITDLLPLNIKVPESGFYVVFEKLLIEENKICWERNTKTNSGKKLKRKSCSYQPNLAHIPSVENNVLYAYNKSEWKKHDKIILENPKSYENLIMRKYHDKYLVPSLEITLSN